MSTSRAINSAYPPFNWRESAAFMVDPAYDGPARLMETRECAPNFWRDGLALTIFATVLTKLSFELVRVVVSHTSE
jgi:hypothetical protein